MLNTEETGQQFLDLYEKLGCKIIPGSSLLDPSVPMTFVMSAGLVQVETSAGFRGGRTGNRYTMIQNCFRYFDLQNIGKSPFHLSLFQMPGAFTFGPQSRENCIENIWSLLTNIYALPTTSLWATYFGGGSVCGIPFEADIETRDAWRNVGIPNEQLVGLNSHHNFWKQGAGIVGKDHVAKCGPNTEIFFDLGENRRCSVHCRPGCGCGRFVEIMNTLFIIFHLDEATGIVSPLEDPFTETVIGMERITMLLQGVPSVFETDKIRPLMEYICCNTRTTEKNAYQYERIIADHIRALLFLTADGAPAPGKGGRSRLMRKLVRQMLTAQKMLNIDNSFFQHFLIEKVLNIYADSHPHLIPALDKVTEYIFEEEKRFENTLEKGFRRFDRSMKQKERKVINAKDIAEYQERHGIPKSLLKKRLTENRITFECPMVY